MQRSAQRILTTHAGSLPRPSSLTQLFFRRAQGQAVDESKLADEGRKAVAWSVGKQIESGVDVINNGEQQRESFVLYLRRRLTGLADGGSRPSFADLDRYPEYNRTRQEQLSGKQAVSNWGQLPRTVGAISYADPAAIRDECADFARALEPVRGRFTEPFFAAPSPGILATIVKNEHYDSFDAYVSAIADALRVEYEAIHAAGFLLQLDCPDLALERHVTYKDRPVGEFVAFVETVVAAINRAIVNIPRDRVRLHACWGNYEGPHDSDVPLADILPAIRQAKVGGFVLPFANPRHAHEYTLFRKLPLDDDQVLVAGVVDTLTNFVEHPEVIAERLERVAAAVGDPTRVLAGTDCGFDTSAGMGRISPDIVWAKLRSMSEGARIASARLFK